jgi:hypothetical protein
MEKITGSKAANAEYRDILAATQTKIAKAKAKIEHLIERYSAFTSTVTGGHNIEFQKKGRSLAGMFMLLPLDLGISKKDYTPYTCAFNADILNFELPLIIEQLPPWALCKTKMGDLKPVSIATTASQNFLQTARGNLSVFLDQDIRDLTQDSTFGLDDVVKQPTVIYIALPAEEINTESETKESASKIARLGSLLCSSLYSAVNNFLAASAKEYLERPLIFMLDELPALGRLDFLEQLFSLGRGKNIFAAPAIQSINQINRIYGESLRKSIFASAAALIVTQIGNDVDTARYLSELSGFVSITKKNYSYGEAGDIKGHSTHEQKEKAVEAAEFTSNQKFGDFFVILQSLKPYKMHTQNFIKSNVWKNFEKEINDFKEPFKVYQAAIDSVNLYTDVLPTISKRL